MVGVISDGVDIIDGDGDGMDWAEDWGGMDGIAGIMSK
jgi:hypothetical protein